MNPIDFGPRWQQTDRLLILHTPLGGDVLLAESVQISESLGPVRQHAGFRIELTALSSQSGFDARDLLGKPVRLDLQTSLARDDRRPFHGHVSRFERRGANGGFARYHLTIEPWLALLGHRKDSYIFQDKSVIDIVDELLGDWQGQGALNPQWQWALADRNAYPKRSFTVQFEETDLAFLRRILADEGLFCWFEHAADDSAALGTHTLLIADHNGAFEENVQPRVRFTQPGATMSEDSLERWEGGRRLATNESAAATWDYRVARSQSQMSASLTDNGAANPRLTSHDDAGQYGWQSAGQGERRMLNRQQSIDARNKLFSAQGTLRGASPATRFSLLEHPEHGFETDTDFVIVDVMHQARNNLTERIPEALEALGSIAEADNESTPLYRNWLTVMRAHVPWRPQAVTDGGQPVFSRPEAPASLSAVVVGAGEPTHTDRDLRVRVQFAWQRGANAANRLDHPAGDDNAPASDALGVWLRMATPVAGANWGGHFHPRPGQEVTVGFLHGNIDRPVILSASYNGRGTADAQTGLQAQGDMQSSGNAPAFFSGEASEPHRHRASLSGLKTQQLSASRSGHGGYNQIVFDDTPGQARIEIGTTEYASALQLGHLKHQRDNARHDSLGHGASVHTQASGALRAGSGLLISADVRPDARGAHLDSREPTGQVQEAQALSTALADVAAKQNAALAGDSAAAELSANAALQAATDVMQATGSRSAGAGASEGTFVAVQGGSGTVPAWSKPRIQYAAPKGIAQLTPANAMLVSGKTTSLTTGQATNWVAQANQSLATKDGIALFTVGKPEGRAANTETGIHLHAASGKVSTQAQSGQIRAAADKKVTVASTAANVNASAKGHLLATAKGAYLKIDGGNIQIHAPGAVQLKASQKNLTGPASASPAGLSFPKGGDPAVADYGRQVFDERFCVKDEVTGEPLRYFSYRIEDDSGQVLARGMTDDCGLTARVMGSKAQGLKILADDD